MTDWPDCDCEGREGDFVSPNPDDHGADCSRGLFLRARNEAIASEDAEAFERAVGAQRFAEAANAAYHATGDKLSALAYLAAHCGADFERHGARAAVDGLPQKPVPPAVTLAGPDAVREWTQGYESVANEPSAPALTSASPTTTCRRARKG